ncbi:MAG: hypothetical protein FWD64_13675, partial [Acidobacteriaceae bacterium]|nr:hypothetical protein [Acidobacteriaceae bacterium]
PGTSASLQVKERRNFAQVYRLIDTNDSQLTLILQNAKASPALMQKLEPVLAAKRNLTELNRQMMVKKLSIDGIVEDQKRLRDNLSALKGSAEERDLARRYTQELNRQEDALAALRKDQDALSQQQQAAQQNLADLIENLNIEEQL